MPEEGRKGFAIVTVDPAREIATALVDAVIASARRLSLTNMIVEDMDPDDADDLLDDLDASYAAMRDTEIGHVRTWLVDTLRRARTEAL